MEPGIYPLIMNLGPSAAAVTVTLLFLWYLRTLGDQQRQLMDRLFEQLKGIAEEKAAVIRENGQAMTRMEIALGLVVDKLTDLHLALNSRLTTLIETTREMAHQQGISEGIAGERTRAAENEKTPAATTRPGREIENHP